MDNLMTKAARNIAQNLIAIRQKKGFSQQQLANLAGVTRASIALLESGSSNPTLEILIKICQALQLSLDEFVASARAECRYIKAKDVPLDRRSKGGIVLRKLLPDKIPATEIDEIQLDAGVVMTGSPHIEGTREYFTCVSGQFSVGVLGETYRLEKGDVLSFPGDKPHSYKNVGRAQATGVSVVLFSTAL